MTKITSVPFSGLFVYVSEKIATIPENQILATGKYPIYNEQCEIVGYTNEKGAYSNVPVFVTTGSTPRELLLLNSPFYLAEKRGKASVGGEIELTNLALKIIKPTNKDFSTAYLYYYLYYHLKANCRDLVFSCYELELEGEPVKTRTTALSIWPLVEQKKRVKTLDMIKTVCNKAEEKILLYEKTIPSKFFEMFGDPVTNPQKWPTHKLGDLCKIIDGISPSGKDYLDQYKKPVLWVTPSDFSGSKFISQAKKSIPDRDLYSLYKNTNRQKSVLAGPNTLLVSVVHPAPRSVLYNEIKDTDTKLEIAFTPATVSFSEEIKAFEFCADKINAVFMYYFLSFYSPYLLKRLRFTYGDEEFSINHAISIIKKLPVMLPPLGLQNEFEEIEIEAEAAKNKAQAELNEYEELFLEVSEKFFKQS